MRHPWRKLVLAKLLLTALAVSSCATAHGARTFAGIAWPGELHGGDSGKRPVAQGVFVAGGFALDALLAQAKVPAVPRALADGVLAWAVRVPRWGGRTEAAHVMVVAGAFSDAWLRAILKMLR